MPTQVSLAQVWSYLSAGQPGHTDAGLALQQKLEPLNCHVERLSLFRSSALELRLYSEQPLDGHILSEIQNALRILLGIREVRLFVRFSAETLEAGDAACRLLPWLADEFRRTQNGLTAAMLSSLDCHSEGDELIIRCPAAIRSQFSDEFVVEAAGFFEERAALNVQLQFDILEDEDEQTNGVRSWLDQLQTLQDENRALMNAWEDELLSEDPEFRSADVAGEYAVRGQGGGSKKTGSNGTKPNYRAKRSESHIWGRSYPDLSPQPIKQFTNETGLTKFSGCVTRWETRLISEGQRSLCKFSIHEANGAINCTLFCSNEDADMLTEIFGTKKEVWVTAAGEVTYDGRFAHDLVAKVLGLEYTEAPEPRKDLALVKRVELHCHSKKSANDAMADVEKLIETAARFGHPAVSITDHGVVQAYPDAYDTLQKLKRSGAASPDMKLIYGMEGYLVDDGPSAVFSIEEPVLGDSYVALDLETSGLNPASDRIIEVAAVRFNKGPDGHYWPEERYESLIKYEGQLDHRIVELTQITDEMLAEQGREMDDVMQELHDFLGDDPVVGHNILFDLGFLRHEGFRTPTPASPRLKFNPIAIDTLELARFFLPDLRSHRLGEVAQVLQVRLDQAHRAMGDALACGAVFNKLWQSSGCESLKMLQQKIGHQQKDEYINVKRKPWHIVFLAEDELGLYNLYRLISESHTSYFKGRPRIPRSLLRYLRNGLIVGAACEAGEVLRAIRTRYEENGGDLEATMESLNDPEMKQIGRFYDYLEIQPLGNNSFMTRDSTSVIKTEEDLKNLSRLVLALGKIVGRPVVATSDAHFIDPEDGIYRKMLLTSMNFADAEEASDLYFRTTDEMLEEFAWLGEDLARRVVLDEPRKIADRVKPDMPPFPEGTFPPVIAEAADEVRRLTWGKADELYGYEGKIPAVVADRAERELSSIIDNGFAIMYYISHKLVKQTYDDGQVVGSRGSVGSSLVATLCGITEVNPLPPHHYCPACKYSIFDESGEYGSGYDLPDRSCPQCDTHMIREGQDIPFETFLGFHGDKQPDIDLNFSGEYQAEAHEFITEMFGKQHTYRAGTITSYKEKNALGIVLKYLEKNNAFATEAEKVRLASGLIDVKRSTGQHPGGIVVVPKEWEIFDFTPIQYPANKLDAVMKTTHFDFHSMDETILKLDILGHDDPTMLTVLSEMTGVDINDIPIPDEKVMSLFTSQEALGLRYETATDAATLGLPELGTHMARDMIKETRPSKFYDLVQLMGLSHGTDVWKGNAQDLIRSGTCTIEEVIGCRDSIMTTLIQFGLPSKDAFDIMERVRKGRGLTEEQEVLMNENSVPDWYIDSCKKIKYMFPKAHAAAYIISSLRIAWFKVYKPAYYYAAYFSVRANEFDYGDMCRPIEEIRADRERIGREFMRAKDRDQKVYYIYELVEEMHARGIRFVPIDVSLSNARRFQVVSDTEIRPALNTVQGVSTAVGNQIVAAREESGFISQDELQSKSGVGPAVIENLRTFGCMGDLPETSQITLFDMIG